MSFIIGKYLPSLYKRTGSCTGWPFFTILAPNAAATRVASPFTRYRNAFSQQLRFLSLHEYQSVNLMRSFGIQCPLGEVAKSADEAQGCAIALGKDKDYVVKAQILAGGRGLGHFRENQMQSGIHICTSPEQVKHIAQCMIGNTLVTKQTGKNGKICNSVLVSERVYIRKEKYFAILMDREYGGILLLGSAIGGTSIEDIAAKNPDAIIKYPIDFSKGLTLREAEKFAEKMEFGKSLIQEAANCIMGIYNLFVKKDCTMIEVNPFAETNDGRILVCDAKVNFDDNSDFRQKDIFALRDSSQEDPREVLATKFHLNYVGLDGTIGCMANGAGMAMATMDLIKLNGGNPANFLDIGGGADKDQVVEAFRILQMDPQVKVLMINIFGGIMRCDVIALGIIHASQEVGLSKPLVVRMEGTNQDTAKDILDQSGLRMLFISDFEEAAKKAVKMTEILQLAETAALDVSFAM